MLTCAVLRPSGMALRINGSVSSDKRGQLRLQDHRRACLWHPASQVGKSVIPVTALESLEHNNKAQPQLATNPGPRKEVMEELVARTL
ncbi:hypothetical protein MHYP_G00110040 [Metynnis hypsauchen]